MRIEYEIVGLDCPNCAARVERSLQKIEGIQSVSVNFLAEKIVAECEESAVEAVAAQIEAKIAKSDPHVTLERLS